VSESRKKPKQANRRERLRAALRENLKRRKAQARGRSAAQVGKGYAPQRESGGNGKKD
jgi:hypothetical protein